MIFTSDLHLHHKNILKFCKNTRGGITCVDEMNETLIKNWNDQVGPNDVVHVLGDISFGGSEKTIESVKRLNGRLHLKRGNHDNVQVLRQTKKFDSIEYYERVKIDGHWVILFHYPIMDWEMMSHGSFHLYGHIHGNKKNMPGGRSLDVGIDNRPNGDMKLWSWDDIRDRLLAEPIRSHGGSNEEVRNHSV